MLFSLSIVEHLYFRCNFESHPLKPLAYLTMFGIDSRFTLTHKVKMICALPPSTTI